MPWLCLLLLGSYLLKGMGSICIEGQLLLLQWISTLNDCRRKCFLLLWSSINIAVNKIILHNLMMLGWNIAMNIRWRSLTVSHHLEGILGCHPERSLWSVLAHSVLNTQRCIVLGKPTIVARANVASLWSLSAVDATTSLWRIIASRDVIMRCRRNRWHLMIRSLWLILWILSWVVNDYIGCAVCDLQRFRLVSVRGLGMMWRSFHCSISCCHPMREIKSRGKLLRRRGMRSMCLVF